MLVHTHNGPYVKLCTQGGGGGEGGSKSRLRKHATSSAMAFTKIGPQDWRIITREI